MKNCPICRIVRGETEARILAETDLVMAFLHVAPINPGHALVVPKKHHNSVTTIPESVAGEMMSLGSQVGQALIRSTNGGGFNLHLANGAPAGQGVPHTHLHVVPRDSTDGFFWNWRNVEIDDTVLDGLAESARKRLARDPNES